MARYVVAPEAARDLIQIWRYIKEQSSIETANRIDLAISGQDYFASGDARRRTLAQGLDGAGREVLPHLFLSDCLPP